MGGGGGGGGGGEGGHCPISIVNIFMNALLVISIIRTYCVVCDHQVIFYTCYFEYHFKLQLVVTYE